MINVNFQIYVGSARRASWERSLDYVRGEACVGFHLGCGPGIYRLYKVARNDSIQHPKPETLNPAPCTLHLKPDTLKPAIEITKPYTLTQQP